MAKIGLNNFRYAKLTEASDGTPFYDGAKKPAKAISCNVSISNNSATLYADDYLSESDTSFQSGSVTIGIDDEDTETMANLLGHDVDESGRMVRNVNDVAPYVALGRVIVKMVNGVYKYKVEFLYKVKFSEPSQEDNTKGESLEFNTSELEGTVSALANGNWSETKTFDNKADAIEYLESLMAVATTYTVTNTLTNCVNSNDATSVNAGASYSATISAEDGYTMSSVSVTMGGTDVTSAVVNDNVITIANVTGNIVIVASAE